MLEYVDHLHEHFIDPVIIHQGAYLPPTAPGYSITIKPETLASFDFPAGRYGQHKKKADWTDTFMDLGIEFWRCLHWQSL